MEAMSLQEMPWENHHHRSSFLSPCQMVEEKFSSDVSYDIVMDPQYLIITCGVESEGNISNITKTTPIEMSVKQGVSENIHIGHNSSSSEIK